MGSDLSKPGFHLSIVIPAYKPDFLEKALRSIDSQTDQRFQVFIGDDASPADLFSIAKPFVERRGWVYHRFSQNLGRENLVGHWNRCVSMSSSEWIWLFSDDDIMSDDCVSTFYDMLGRGVKTNVVRFNLQVIDEEGQILSHNISCPDRLTGFELGKLRFSRLLLSSAVEYVFHRDSFDNERGFVNFPLAWCSDDASWIAFAEDLPVYTLPGGLVSWRLSKVNISGRGGVLTRPKIEAALSFIEWYNNKFPAQVDVTLRGEQIIWLRLQMIQLDYVPTFPEVLRICLRLRLTSPLVVLRTINDLFCKCHVYVYQVNRNAKSYSGLRYWMSKILPQF